MLTKATDEFFSWEKIMGNYHSLEFDFIERTLRLIDQYYDSMESYPFEEQYNYTLTINCLLGLIVMPKERVISFIPTDRLTEGYLVTIGAPSLKVGEGITTLRGLIQSLRHAVAHFDINIISVDEQNLIDRLEFLDSENDNALVASFRANELLPFLRYYAKCLLENMRQYRNC